ncbi:hypothetical protein QE152_g34136 [Popillia japonica]|uniref:Gag-pol polyprotein n=1 Tax=Popillia japonica TaxID=7064 RepID=A0AAW1IUL0_POPJA
MFLLLSQLEERVNKIGSPSGQADHVSNVSPQLEERVNKIGSPSGQADHVSNVSPVVPTMTNVIPSNVTADARQVDTPMSFSHNLKIKDLIPKFDGRHGCPVVFLISIKRVITADTAPIQLYNILRSSLVNDAATWFSVVEKAVIVAQCFPN